MDYIRPIPLTGPLAPPDALRLAGGWCRFTHVEVLRRDAAPRVVDAHKVDTSALTAPRAALAGLSLNQPRIMGILAPGAEPGVGADILDVGEDAAADRIRSLKQGGVAPAISISTTSAATARAAVTAGAAIVNDASALGHDPALVPFVAMQRLTVVLMHAGELDRTADALLTVYDTLAARVQAATAAGIPRDRIVVDPGIGFGKSQSQTLAILRRISLFHGLGLPVMLGISRKRLIGSLTDEPQADRRLPGTLAAMLAAVGQGVQVHRVHDVAEARAALTIWQAMTGVEAG